MFIDLNTMIFSPKKFNRSDLILFFERLDLYISSGLTLNKAIMILREGTLKHQEIAVKNIYYSIEQGGSFARASRKFLGISHTVFGLVENGEASGKLSEALRSSKQLLEKEDELWKKCVNAMAYPAIIGIFSMLLTIGLMRGVMPQIVPMLKGLHVELPLLTRVVMTLSDGLLIYGIYLLLIIIFLPIMFMYVYRNLACVRKSVQNILIRIPIIGKLFHSYSLSLFLLSCGSLVESGLPSATAFRNATNTISLIPLKDELSKELIPVSQGIPISQTLKKITRIQPFVSPLLSAGEMSGTLGKSMIRASYILDRGIEHSLKRLTSLVEPVMMAGMGIVVGAIALSIMMPIYNISKVLQH